MSLSYDIVFYTPIVFVALYFLANLIIRTPRNVCIVVLGDIGRSPRMQYHALSFADEGFRVYLVGYKGSQPLKRLTENENIQIYHVAEPPQFFKRLPKLYGYVVKVIWQSVTLAFSLLLLPKMSSIFVQNPPSIPTLFIAYVVSCIRFCTLVIDWHNYGYTILAMSLREGNPLVSFSEWYEGFCGRLASYNICVTHAMRENLQDKWNIKATTVYDRPSSIFQTADLESKHNLFTKLSEQYPVFLSRDKMEGCTSFTRKTGEGSVTVDENRPVLMVSSTSWTEDEDFGILLKALEAYDDESKKESLPPLICVITGKGPQKCFYLKKIEERQWKNVQFCLPWLEAEDYPVMLGSADIGVCLHTSSSGLDLPMKVVDMFGCGLPVCAVNFKCIGELVQHRKNGLVFNDDKELTSNLKELLQGFPGQSRKNLLSEFRGNLTPFQTVRWHDQWKQNVLPIFVEIGNSLMPSRRETMPSRQAPPYSEDENKKDN